MKSPESSTRTVTLETPLAVIFLASLKPSSQTLAFLKLIQSNAVTLDQTLPEVAPDTFLQDGFEPADRYISCCMYISALLQ